MSGSVTKSCQKLLSRLVGNLSRVIRTRAGLKNGHSFEPCRNNRPKKQGLKPASAPEGTSDFANGVVYAFLRPVLRSRRHRRRSEVADSSDEQITRLGQNDRAPDISQPAVWSTFSLESPATRRTVRSCLLPRRKRTRHIHIRTRRSRTLAGSTGSSNRSRRN